MAWPSPISEVQPRAYLRTFTRHHHHRRRTGRLLVLSSPLFACSNVLPLFLLYFSIITIVCLVHYSLLWVLPLTRTQPQLHDRNDFSSSVMASSPEHPSYIALPPPPLRSAMKHSSSSRPSTPSQTPNSPPVRYTQSPYLSGSSPGRSLSQATGSTFLASGSPSAPQSPRIVNAPLPAVVAQGYTPKVGFDTFEDPQASMFSYTLHVQSEGYARTKGTRVFLCASSPDESGNQALDWALESLVQDGDEFVVFRGADDGDLGQSFCSAVHSKN